MHDHWRRVASCSSPTGLRLGATHKKARGDVGPEANGARHAGRARRVRPGGRMTGHLPAPRGPCPSVSGRVDGRTMALRSGTSSRECVVSRAGRKRRRRPPTQATLSARRQTETTETETGDRRSADPVTRAPGPAGHVTEVVTVRPHAPHALGDGETEW